MVTAPDAPEGGPLSQRGGLPPSHFTKRGASDPCPQVGMTSSPLSEVTSLWASQTLRAGWDLRGKKEEEGGRGLCYKYF